METNSPVFTTDELLYLKELLQGKETIEKIELESLLEKDLTKENLGVNCSVNLKLNYIEEEVFNINLYNNNDNRIL